MFIIDFDDTLFNTKKYKYAMFKAVRKCGVPEKLCQMAYKKARNNSKKKAVYDHKKYAQILSKYGFNKNEILKALEKIKITPFLFKDTIYFLKKIKLYKEPIILLTLGNKEFQCFKLKKLKIDKYFDQIITVNKKKEKIVKNIISKVSDKNIWFINNDIKETKNIYKKFPNLKPILKKSSFITENKYKNLDFPHFLILKEIYNYISKNK